jgi:hypothetical protein
MEILISLTILMVGLMGIMAIFPLGVRYTTQIGEETHGSVIAESVIQAVELGLHKMKGYRDDKPFIIFMGPGVEGPFPAKFDPTTVNTSADCYVEFPTGNLTYMYPRNQDSPEAPEEFEGTPGMSGHRMITVTWLVGKEIAEILEEGRDAYAYPRDYDAMIRDTWPRYSYAFTLERARIDSDRDGEITETDDASNHLYELAVYVYRNFPKTPGQAQQEWNRQRPSRRMRGVITQGPFRTLITF